jgi:hypothetical protein
MEVLLKGGVKTVLEAQMGLGGFPSQGGRAAWPRLAIVAPSRSSFTHSLHLDEKLINYFFL